MLSRLQNYVFRLVEDSYSFLCRNELFHHRKNHNHTKEDKSINRFSRLSPPPFLANRGRRRIFALFFGNDNNIF